MQVNPLAIQTPGNQQLKLVPLDEDSTEHEDSTDDKGFSDGLVTQSGEKEQADPASSTTRKRTSQEESSLEITAKRLKF